MTVPGPLSAASGPVLVRRARWHAVDLLCGKQKRSNRSTAAYRAGSDSRDSDSDTVTCPAGHGTESVRLGLQARGTGTGRTESVPISVTVPDSAGWSTADSSRFI